MFHKSTFPQKMNCQRTEWDQARFSSLVLRFEYMAVRGQTENILEGKGEERTNEDRSSFGGEA